MIKLAATLTSKGQVTIPAEIRKTMGVRQGDQLVFVLNENQQWTVIPRRRRSIFESRQSLPPLDLGRPSTQADVDEAIGEAMDEQEARVRRRSK
jgi:AbrB family looped-hinge helix DNA binding protein